MGTMHFSIESIDNHMVFVLLSYYE